MSRTRQRALALLALMASVALTSCGLGPGATCTLALVVRPVSVSVPPDINLRATSLAGEICDAKGCHEVQGHRMAPGCQRDGDCDQVHPERRMILGPFRPSRIEPLTYSLTVYARKQSLARFTGEVRSEPFTEGTGECRQEHFTARIDLTRADRS